MSCNFITVVLLLATAAVGVMAGMKDACLYAHNEIRNFHWDTPPLTWDDGLAHKAQSAADTLIKTESIIDEGMNLYTTFPTDSIMVSPAVAVFTWFQGRLSSDQLVQYAYKQLIWKSSTALGCGRAIALSNEQFVNVIVAYYSPPFNTTGAELQNVHPLKSNAKVPQNSDELKIYEVATMMFSCGGTGGEEFNHKELYEENGPITSIEAWGNDQMTGIRVSYGLVQSPIHGTSQEIYSKFDLADDERVTEIRNYYGYAILMKTNKTRSYYPHGIKYHDCGPQVVESGFKYFSGAADQKVNKVQVHW